MHVRSPIEKYIILIQCPCPPTTTNTTTIPFAISSPIPFSPPPSRRTFPPRIIVSSIPILSSPSRPPRLQPTMPSCKSGLSIGSFFLFTIMGLFSLGGIFTILVTQDTDWYHITPLVFYGFGFWFWVFLVVYSYPCFKGRGKKDKK